MRLGSLVIPDARRTLPAMLMILAIAGGTPRASAAGPTTTSAPAAAKTDMRAILPADQWQRVEAASDRALAFLAVQQQPDGRFPVPSKSLDFSQPAVTALAVMAFLSRGHVPDQGPYGKNITRGIEYVLSCQQKDGLLALQAPSPGYWVIVSEAAAYNHAISGLMLAEAYGMTTGDINTRIRAAIESALELALRRTPQPKRYAEDEGGWRYPIVWKTCDSDLSVTSWHLMFLRSCRNAGFKVSPELIDQALGFVQRCFDKQDHHFWYALRDKERVWTRAMTGAGILALSLAGRHNSEIAQQAGDWLLQHPFDDYRGKSRQVRPLFLRRLLLQPRRFSTRRQTLVRHLSGHRPDASGPPATRRLLGSRSRIGQHVRSGLFHLAGRLGPQPALPVAADLSAMTALAPVPGFRLMTNECSRSTLKSSCFELPSTPRRNDGRRAFRFDIRILLHPILRIGGTMR